MCGVYGHPMASRRARFVTIISTAPLFGLKFPRCTPGPRRGFLRLRRGTHRPTPRQRRWIRLLLACQPSAGAVSAPRRPTQRGRRSANARRKVRSAGSSSLRVGSGRRWVPGQWLDMPGARKPRTAPPSARRRGRESGARLLVRASGPRSRVRCACRVASWCWAGPSRAPAVISAASGTARLPGSRCEHGVQGTECDVSGYGVAAWAAA